MPRKRKAKPRQPKPEGFPIVLDAQAFSFYVAPQPPRSLADVSLGAFAIDGVTVTVTEERSGYGRGYGQAADAFALHVVVHVRDLVTGDPNTITRRQFRPIQYWEDAPAQLRGAMIRREVIEALTHEVDEWLRVDGKRVTDPHPEVTARDADRLRGVQASEIIVDEFRGGMSSSVGLRDAVEGASSVQRRKSGDER